MPSGLLQPELGLLTPHLLAGVALFSIQKPVPVPSPINMQLVAYFVFIAKVNISSCGDLFY